MNETSGDFDQISEPRAVSASSIDFAYLAMRLRMALASVSATAACGLPAPASTGRRAHGATASTTAAAITTWWTDPIPAAFKVPIVIHILRGGCL